MILRYQSKGHRKVAYACFQIFYLFKNKHTDRCSYCSGTLFSVSLFIAGFIYLKKILHFNIVVTNLDLISLTSFVTSLAAVQ